MLIILWIARGKAWKYGKSNDEDEETHPNGVTRLSFSSRPARFVGELGMDDVHPDTSRNASWSTVVGGNGAEHQDGDAPFNVVKLGLCGSEPSSVIDDLKV